MELRKREDLTAVAPTERQDRLVPQDADALAMELEMTRCRLTQALRIQDEYREMTALQRARIQFLEQKTSPAATAPARRDAVATAGERPALAPVRAPRLQRRDLVGPGGAVPTDEARRQQRLCQNPLCTVTPTVGRLYCSGSCATKHCWAEEKRMRKRERVETGTILPIDRSRLGQNLCQNPTCEREAGASGRYCSYSCAATHRNAVRRQQLAASREATETGEILLEPCPPEPAGGTLWQMEKNLIVNTLAQLNGNRTHAAHALGISIRTIRNKLREYRGADGPLSEDVGRVEAGADA